jgi:DNA-binding NtrC family response regulator
MSPVKPLKTLIVEDVPEMRILLEECVKKIPQFLVVGSAQSTWEARAMMHKERAEIVLLDEFLPGESSFDLFSEFIGLGIKVIALTGLENPTHLVWDGALGRVRKPEIDQPRTYRSKKSQDLRGFEHDLLKLIKIAG